MPSINFVLSGLGGQGSAARPDRIGRGFNEAGTIFVRGAQPIIIGNTIREGAGAAINITLFSYDGGVHLGINSDRAAVADHDLLVRCLLEAIDETLSLAS